jgi:hypothetical protein
MITVTLKTHGILRDYFGIEPKSVQMENGATLKDFLQVVNSLWGSQLPAYIWDTIEKKFCGAVYVLIENKVIEDPFFGLEDGTEIHLIKAFTGGRS